MDPKSLFRLAAIAATGWVLCAKSVDWQSGNRYSYVVHANGRTWSFDETKQLPLTINGPVRLAVDGEKTARDR